MPSIRYFLTAAFAAAALVFSSLAGAQSADPPARVARLAYLSGDVQFAPAGASVWGTADVNRPLITGDRLLTGSDGRAALELGNAALRINRDSAFNFLQLDNNTTQVELSQGTLNLRVRRLRDGQTYEIDTPTAAFVASQPGTYRVDIAPGGSGAMVTVFDGAGTVYGENGASRPVVAGQSYRFDDPMLVNVTVNGLPAPDDFDRFCFARDSRYQNSRSRRYVSADVIGYDDLDDYGDWQPTPDYGEVWYPANIGPDWVPYRDGHWAWIDPWGWTWVDDEPWGFAPFHYGRWAYVGDRWGWVPGPPVERAVYAPALVAFVGGSGLSLSISIGGGGYDNGYGGGYGQPIGWFPLGPRDIYWPPYPVSRDYFNNVNITNIRNVYVNKTVINNYYNSYAANPYAAAPVDYAYHNNPRAFTVVPRNVFADARPVAPAVLRNIQPAMLAKVTVAPPRIAPTPASLGIKPNARPIPASIAKALERTVIARHAPPPPPLPFAVRESLIARQSGAPLPVSQLRDLRRERAQAEPQPPRVRLVQAAPEPGGAALLPMKPGMEGARDLPNPAQQAPRGLPNPAHAATAIKPIVVPIRPAEPDAPARAAPLRPGELPSARFVHPQRTDEGLPQPPVLRPVNPAAPIAPERGKLARMPMPTAESAAAASPRVAVPQPPREATPRNRENGFVHAPHAGPQPAPQVNPQDQINAEPAAQMPDRQAQLHAEQARLQQQQAAQARAVAAQQATQQHDAQAREAQQRAEQARIEQLRAQQQQAQQRAEQARMEQQRAEQARMEQQRAAQEQAQQRAMQQQEQQRAMQEQQSAAAAQREAQMRDIQALQAQQRAAMEQQRAEQMRMQHAPPPPVAPPPQRPPAKKPKDEQQQDRGNR